MDIPWEDVRLFLAVAETGSLSGAARQLRIGQPTVSRRLAALEYQLGRALFRRSVDGAVLTGVGERLLLPARRMAEWAGEVGRAAKSSEGHLQGIVRITAPPYPCAAFLAPFAAWLAGKHPGLQLEVISSPHQLDLHRGEADLALRHKKPEQEGLTVVKSFSIESAAFASKTLAARLPRKPCLTDIPWLAFAPPMDTLPPNPQLEQLIPGFTPVFTSDNYLVLAAAAEAGLGALPMPVVRHAFAGPSQLVALPVELGPYKRLTYHLVCAKSALDIPRVRLLSDLFVSEMERTIASPA
ncbi:LysR family transcriptional regulator [Stigmatella sp. ncwal1]|uniref:LysR family transcriptional regulator n=1 Tax=Stigmatella ashevillensis TaxID=2995309 RepID=A0ABT5DNT6_9BACT|nr:LysR family transcriptional regulator [Stigmatella ashevillena]MDC0714793.1 LysR family transcriptional regulator [Stigmatella ashevillena]